MQSFGLTIAEPLGQWGQVGQVWDHHHAAHQGGGATLNTKADLEAIQQGDFKLAGVDLRQVRYWSGREEGFQRAEL